MSIASTIALGMRVCKFSLRGTGSFSSSFLGLPGGTGVFSSSETVRDLQGPIDSLL